MTPAEKELRTFIRAAIHNDCDYPTASRLITAMRKEIREECAKVAEETCERLLTLPPSPGDKPRQLCTTAAAIRRLK